MEPEEQSTVPEQQSTAPITPPTAPAAPPAKSPMSAKMQECFKPHVLMHSLIGLGLGIFLASAVDAFAKVWLGLVLIVIGVAFDLMRKS